MRKRPANSRSTLPEISPTAVQGSVYLKQILSSGIIPVYRKEGKIGILLLRAYKNWDFPKGVVEVNEDPLGAALRELREETSISKVSFPWGQIYKETALPTRNKIIRYYLAECATQIVELPISPELGAPEHHEYRWVSFQQARDLLSARLLPILDWAESLLHL